jgi:F0F1-type ATP synthase assembly protein I
VFEFTGTIAAGVLVGHLLDRNFETEPQFLIGLTLFAVVGGFVRLVWVLRSMERLRE